MDIMLGIRWMYVCIYMESLKRRRKLTETKKLVSVENITEKANKNCSRIPTPF